MRSSIRRINSTGRTRINRRHIKIEMLPSAPGEPLKAKATLALEGYGFPASSLVVVEAYHRSSGMRFDCGTIDALSVPDPLILTDVDRSGSTLFRLKVIDDCAETGKLLGSAERIEAEREAKGEDSRRIFPVHYRDLGHDVWKVEVEPGSRPILIINKRIPGFLPRVLENPLTVGIFLSGAFRFVLQELIRETGTDEDEGLGWKEDWLEYCRAELGAVDDPRGYRDEEKEKNWIDDMVNRFCENRAFIDRMRRFEGEVP